MSAARHHPFTFNVRSRYYMPEWRPVVNFQGYYEVSDEGQIRGVDRMVPCRVSSAGVRRIKSRTMAQQLNTAGLHGRWQVLLCRDSTCTRLLVHVAVCEAFRGPRPDGHVVRHLDGDRDNNRLDNLQWGTPSANTLDSVVHGTHNSARKTHCPRGHEYSESNTRIATTSSGGLARHCRECGRLRRRGLRRAGNRPEEVHE